MRRLLLCMCITSIIRPMEKFLQTLVPAAVGGFMGYSASQQQHQSESKQQAQAYDELLAEHEQLKSDLSRSGLLMRGIHQTVLCNPLNTLFNRSIEVGDETGMNVVLRHSQDTFNINGLDANGTTALHIASRKKNEYCIKYLCTLQANPNTPDILGMTPLHYAAQANDITIIACLIAHGADPNIRRKEGNLSPLMAAFNANKHEAMQFLLALKHKRAEIDRAPSPDHSVNLLGSLSIAHEIQRTLQNSPQNSHDSLTLIFNAFLKRNPECLICLEELPATIYITRCCETGICPTCINDSRLDKDTCAHCRKPLPQKEPYMLFTMPAKRSSSPEASSSSAAASSSSS